MKKLKGIYTIELALLMPILISIILAVSYAVFLLHDKNRVESAANESIIRSERMMRHNLSLETGKIDYETINQGNPYATLIGSYGEKEEHCKKYLTDRLANGLFLGKVNHINLSLGGTKLKYTVEMQWNIGVPLVKTYFKKQTQVIQRETIYQDAPDFVRKTAALLGGGKDGY